MSAEGIVIHPEERKAAYGNRKGAREEEAAVPKGRYTRKRPVRDTGTVDGAGQGVTKGHAACPILTHRLHLAIKKMGRERRKNKWKSSGPAKNACLQSYCRNRNWGIQEVKEE